MSTPESTAPENRDEVPVSERLRQIAEARTSPWPEDDYVPHEKTRGRDVAVESALTGATLSGGLGRM